MSNWNEIIAFWKQPFSLINSRRDKWLTIIFVNVFAPFFLIFFQPFGVNNYDPTQQIRWYFVLAMIGIGLVNGLVMAFYEFLLVPLLFPARILQNFCLRILLLLLVISFSSFWFYNFMGDWHDWHFSSYLGFIKDVSLMVLLPITGMVLYFKYKNEVEANRSLLAKPVYNQLVWLVAENGKDKLGVDLNQLLYLEAEENYVAIHRQMNGVNKKTLLRTSLKRMEKQLENTPVKRCHRSFMINLIQVKTVSGNTHQAQLYLKQVDVPIPVSRNYLANVTSKLAIPPK